VGVLVLAAAFDIVEAHSLGVAVDLLEARFLMGDYLSMLRARASKVSAREFPPIAQIH
jgi:hypothetical protein